MNKVKNTPTRLQICRLPRTKKLLTRKRVFALDVIIQLAHEHSSCFENTNIMQLVLFRGEHSVKINRNTETGLTITTRELRVIKGTSTRRDIARARNETKFIFSATTREHWAQLGALMRPLRTH